MIHKNVVIKNFAAVAVMSAVIKRVDCTSSYLLNHNYDGRKHASPRATNPIEKGTTLNPTAPRQAKLVHTFGLSGCSWVNEIIFSNKTLKSRICFWRSKYFSLRAVLVDNGGTFENGGVASP